MLKPPTHVGEAQQHLLHMVLSIRLQIAFQQVTRASVRCGVTGLHPLGRVPCTPVDFYSSLTHRHGLLDVWNL